MLISIVRLPRPAWEAASETGIGPPPNGARRNAARLPGDGRGARQSCSRHDIRFFEIFTFEQQRLARHLGAGIAEAVAEV